MSIFKCKICGGSLEFTEGSTVALCQYCGTKQTLPKISDGNNSTLYERADHFRRNNDFDKAISIYEQILNADNTDAEAYWSLVLCRYGIEYVEDPKSNKRIATVNRMQYTSVLADEDYKSALKYADSEQKEIYEAEAREIDSIQKGILAISQKEEPFDVFICYKETDNSGRRTPDSVLANELYHQLDNEGYKVFFSRITLEDKLGTAYEPYIFAALNSAKVMVVIGTKPDYFNAVWVRNEWSRFLALIKNGANKVLIPAYRDMDPYDLPEEFSHLQAQDMSKLGFMQDLIRGIEKLTSASKPKYVMEQPVQSGANIAPLLRRVYLFLEDGDWSSADEYCEKVLDLEPECGEAYLGKLMIDLKIRRREKLSEQTEPFDNNPYYQKALRFGDAKLQNELEGYISTIKNRAERERLLAIYNKGEMLLKSAKTQEDFLNASRVFASINGFEDSETKARLCEEKANEIHFSALYSAATMLMKAAKSEEDYAKASDAFSKIKEYKNSEKLAEECANKADNINKTAIYNTAVALMTGNKARNYKKAITELEKIRGFKDADQKIEYCNTKIEQINSALSAAGLEKQAKSQERADAFREKADALKEKLPLIKKIALLVVPVLVVAIVAVTVLPKIEWNKNVAENSSSEINSGENVESNTESSLESTTESSVENSESSSKPNTSNSNSKPTQSKIETYQESYESSSTENSSKPEKENGVTSDGHRYTVTYQYYDNGDLKKAIFVFETGDVEQQINEYVNNQYSKITWEHRNGNTSKTIHEYENSKIVKITWEDRTGKKTEHYFKDEVFVKRIDYYSDGTISLILERDGDKETETSYRENGTIEMIREFIGDHPSKETHYDENGNVTKVVTF